MNKPEIRAQPIVSFGGIGSARSLAKFYAMLANDRSNGGSTILFRKDHQLDDDNVDRWN